MFLLRRNPAISTRVFQTLFASRINELKKLEKTEGGRELLRPYYSHIPKINNVEVNLTEKNTPYNMKHLTYAAEIEHSETYSKVYPYFGLIPGVFIGHIAGIITSVVVTLPAAALGLVIFDHVNGDLLQYVSVMGLAGMPALAVATYATGFIGTCVMSYRVASWHQALNFVLSRSNQVST